jgi:peptide/nickel transport system substrate-binding protein
MSARQARDVYNTAIDKAALAFLKRFADENRPVRDLRYNLVGGLLPAHVLGSIPPESVTTSGYARKPVCNGPFVVEHWMSGLEIVLERNPNYTLTAPPLLRRLHLKTTSTVDPSEEVKNGRMHALTRDSILPLDVYRWQHEWLEQLGAQVEVISMPARTLEQITFNLEHPAFGEKPVRQAIAHSIGRDKLNAEIMSGKALVMHTFVPLSNWFSLQNETFSTEWNKQYPLRRYEYNPTKANEILDAAGWHRGPDGVRTKGGTKLSFDNEGECSARRSNPIHWRVGPYLEAIGLEPRQKCLGGAEYLRDDGYLAKREHDLAHFAWEVEAIQSIELYTSDSIPSAGNVYKGKNYSGYSNPRYDQLAALVRNEVDRSKLAPILAEMQSIWSEDLPAIPIYARPIIEVRDRTLMNWEFSGLPVYATYKAAAMYFK